MTTKLYISNLAYSTTDSTLKTFFEIAGAVLSVKVIIDRDSGRSKGFAFVEMLSEEAVNNAIATLDGKELDGRSLRVSKAVPQK